ncbi:hypothetical protein A4X06_0g3852 [Tilletia controversa]|uniref:Uncharacterized protein n=3 Tax=Tilletia TaxID=13289 RepID=A0A8X7MTS9_9BASI|nr:hypothetical protein CF336_g3405 [Tilletia laevis]KAE8200127.1 hypothetical protein CF328_g3053 [Tilletia controversa]KAE8203175.1 hypothetical protein CF335_g3131 [Tilletia laevis]KAE8248253.1 hypothetical protein A4X06_0g3852 [Tilletia controversa]KAE8262157.1 hypothetical protein A4X03_0g2674 [Tilletia caries]
MKPATALLTIAAMAFVAQAAPVPLLNANEMPKFQVRAVAGLAGGIFDHFSLHHPRSSRSIGGNDYADTLRMKRAGGGAEAGAVVNTAEAAAGTAVEATKGAKTWVKLAFAGVAGALFDHMFLNRSHNSRSIGENEYGDILRIKREEA